MNVNAYDDKNRKCGKQCKSNNIVFISMSQFHEIKKKKTNNRKRDKMSSLFYKLVGWLVIWTVYTTYTPAKPCKATDAPIHFIEIIKFILFFCCRKCFLVNYQTLCQYWFFFFLFFHFWKQKIISPCLSLRHSNHPNKLINMTKKKTKKFALVSLLLLFKSLWLEFHSFDWINEYGKFARTNSAWNDHEPHILKTGLFPLSMQIC